jgi:hypothetical protein
MPEGLTNQDVTLLANVLAPGAISEATTL